MTTTTLNPADVITGINALTNALGRDRAQSFLMRCGNEGMDIVRELRELPEPSLDEIFNNATRLQNEYKAGRIDRAGRPLRNRTAPPSI